MIQQKPIHAAPPSTVHASLHAKVQLHHPIQAQQRNGIANHLSHFPSHKESLPIAIYQIIQHVQLSTDKLDAIRGVVECDLVYNTLYHLTPMDGPTASSRSRGSPSISGGPGMSCLLRPVSSWKETTSASPWAPLLYPRWPPQHAPGDGKNAVTSQKSSLLAWQWCRYNRLHHEVPYMHQAQGFPGSSDHASLRHPCWPMAGECSQLLPS